MSAALVWGEEGPNAGPERLGVQFELRPRQNMSKSTEAGRPIYDSVEYITIVVPGDRDNIVQRPLRDEDKMRFRRQYDAWRTGLEAPPTGTPLAEWPGVTRAQVEELAFFQVRTVEELAEISDTNAQKVGPIVQLRQKARDYLAQAKSGGALAALRDENERLKLEIVTKDRIIKEQVETITQMQRGSGKKGGAAQ